MHSGSPQRLHVSSSLRASDVTDCASVLVLVPLQLHRDPSSPLLHFESCRLHTSRCDSADWEEDLSQPVGWLLPSSRQFIDPADLLVVYRVGLVVWRSIRLFDARNSRAQLG